MIISVFDRIENIVGKGENSGYQHFLLFLLCFEKASFPDTSKGVIVWKWLNCDDFILILDKTTKFYSGPNSKGLQMTLNFFSYRMI